MHRWWQSSFENGYIKAFCQSLIVEVVFAIFKTVFKKWLLRRNQKMPQAARPACPCWSCFLFFCVRYGEIFFILLAFSHLCLISRVRYVCFNIICVKYVAIRNKFVLKIVSKRAFRECCKATKHLLFVSELPQPLLPSLPNAAHFTLANDF